MTILLVSFSTKVFRGGAVDKGGTKFAWERYFGGFGVFISFSCPGRFYWVDIPKWDLIQLTAVGAGSKTCVWLLIFLGLNCIFL